MNTEQIARVCHEANRSICEAAGDHSQKPWDQADQWQRDSAVKGVEYLASNSEAKPSDQHEAWCADKRKHGWVYGPYKDLNAKTHPCLVEYDKLSFEQRVKDYVFQAVARELLKGV